ISRVASRECLARRAMASAERMGAAQKLALPVCGPVALQHRPPPRPPRGDDKHPEGGRDGEQGNLAPPRPREQHQPPPPRHATLAEPTMFSSAMYTMDAAMSVSMSGGNQSASGARSYADARSVIEWAMVNDVTTNTSGRSRRNGITRHSRNSR